jgi:hypothetical protein
VPGLALVYLVVFIVLHLYCSLTLEIYEAVNITGVGTTTKLGSESWSCIDGGAKTLIIMA